MDNFSIFLLLHYPTFISLILSVNGFDERMQYGGEDRELGERLFNMGIKSKQIRYSAICLHLDHSRGYVQPEMIEKNNRIRKTTKKDVDIKAQPIQYQPKKVKKQNSQNTNLFYKKHYLIFGLFLVVITILLAFGKYNNKVESNLNQNITSNFI